MSCGVDNRLAKMAVKTGTGGSVDFSSGATGVRFKTDGITNTGSILVSDSITGQRTRDVAETRRGAYSVGGQVTFDASLQDILLWAGYALGSTSSGVITPAASLPVFAVMSSRQSGIFRYGDCKVSQFTLSNTGAGLVNGSVDIVGRSYTGTGLSFPSLTLGSDVTYQPLAFSDLVVSIASTEYAINSWQFTINNSVSPQQRNALYPDCLREGDLAIGLNINLPSNSTAYSALAEPDLTGVAATLTLTHPDAAVSCTIELPVLQVPLANPVVANRDEQRWDRNFVAVTDRANAETTVCTITLDTTE